jgi:tetratricopeptide (TPR) repeat protein/transcriptional regulator with XRE-family HTH domain
VSRGADRACAGGEAISTCSRDELVGSGPIVYGTVCSRSEHMARVCSLLVAAREGDCVGEVSGTQHIADNIRDLRVQRRWSARRLAEECARVGATSLTRGTIAKIESGVRKHVTADELAVLSRVLGVSPSALLKSGPVRPGSGESPGGDMLIAGPAEVSRSETASSSPPVATRTLPRDIKSFTGREAELNLVSRLASAADTSGIYVVEGMGGIGKTAFAVHVSHLLAPMFPDGQIFISLFGHSPGRRPVEPGEALASLLLTMGISPGQIPAGLEERGRLWRDRLSGRRVLLVLDDVASSEQVLPLLPGTGTSLVLVTSRRSLTALADAHLIRLEVLSRAESARLLTTLAERPGLDPTDASVDQIIRLCGYLPLAIGLIAARLRHRPAWTASQLADHLASEQNRLASMRAEHLSVTAAFDMSYRNLAANEQRLFRLLGLHPGADIEVYAASALSGFDLAMTRHSLDSLIEQYLISEHSPGRFRMHDLIREHARTVAAAEPSPERDAAVYRLLDYYLQTARAADRFLARRTSATPREADATRAEYVPILSSLDDANAWMDAEHLNLRAAVHHAATSGLVNHATGISEAMNGFLRNRGFWDEALDVYGTSLQAAHGNTDQNGIASALSDLGEIQIAAGDYVTASASLIAALGLYRDLGNQQGQANAHASLGQAQCRTGDFAAAEENISSGITFYRSLGDDVGEANALYSLGVLCHMTGDFAQAASHEEAALRIYRARNMPAGSADALIHLGQIQLDSGDYRAATESVNSALTLFRSQDNRSGVANALYFLGTIRGITGDYKSASDLLGQALDFFRLIGSRLGEGATLLTLGEIKVKAGEYQAAATSLTLALGMFRIVNHRLGEIEAINLIGELALASGAPAEARVRHEEALAIAESIAYIPGQARALEGIGNSYFSEGNPNRGIAPLRQALEIYRQLASRDVARVEAMLSSLG